MTQTPLGRWFHMDPAQSWLLDRDGSLYQLCNGKWSYHCPLLRRQHLPAFAVTGHPCQAPPEPLSQTVIYQARGKIISTGHCLIIPPEQSNQPADLYNYLTSDTNIRECVYDLQIIGSNSSIKSAICEGTLIAVSDGSYKDQYGTASWCIDHNGIFISGDAIAPGVEPDHSSFRSKLMGIYAIMVVMNCICTYFHITTGTVMIRCDGLEALRKTFVYKLDVDDSCFDLLAAIKKVQRTSPIHYLFRHIKGHQDDTGQDLDHWAELNILMDAKAKQFLRKATDSPRYQSLQYDPWTIWIHNKKVTGNLSSVIYSLVHDEEASAYWASKQDLSLESLSKVDWPAVEVACAEVSRGRRVFLSKHISGMCGVGKFMLRWKEWDHDKCPRCGLPEDSKHVWKCANTQVVDL